MLKEIKKRYTAGLIFKGIIFLLLGLAILAYLVWDFLPIGAMQELTSEDVTTVDEGRAEMTLFHTEGYFSYFTDEYDNIVSMDFLVPVGEDMWMGARLDGKSMDAINNNMELYWEKYEEKGEALDWDALQEQYYVVWATGHVEKMDSETRDFYDEYLDYYEMDDEARSKFLPYIFVPAKYGQDLGTEYSILATIFVVCLVGYGLYSIVNAFAAFYFKEIKKFIAESGSSEATLARLEQFYSAVPEIDGFKINDEYFMYLGKGGFKFARSQDVLWIYQHVLTTNYVAKTYTMKIGFSNGKIFDVPTTKKGYEPLVQSLERRLPDVVYGYSDQLKNMFGKNRNEFIAEVERRRRERLGNIE